MCSVSDREAFVTSGTFLQKNGVKKKGDLDYLWTEEYLKWKDPLFSEAKEKQATDTQIKRL